MEYNVITIQSSNQGANGGFVVVNGKLIVFGGETDSFLELETSPRVLNETINKIDP